MRVLSLLPSATEIVATLGHASALVGRSEECDYPPAVRALPIVMRARSHDANRPSGEIDARVRAVRGAGASLYSLDLDLLRSLAPDLVLTQDLCGVCSVTEEEVVRACRISGIAPTIITLSPRHLEDVWQSISTIGDAIGAGPAGRALAETLRRRTERAGRDPPKEPVRTAVVEWLDPPILAGLWTPEIVAAAGGVPLGPGAGAPGERLRWDALGAARPDLVVLSPCSFDVARTRRELADPGLAEALRTVRPRRGFLVADEAYFSRPGPRLADGVELVARCLRGGSPAGGPMPAGVWNPPQEAHVA